MERVKQLEWSCFTWELFWINKIVVETKQDKRVKKLRLDDITCWVNKSSKNPPKKTGNQKWKGRIYLFLESKARINKKPIDKKLINKKPINKKQIDKKLINKKQINKKPINKNQMDKEDDIYAKEIREKVLAYAGNIQPHGAGCLGSGKYVFQCIYLQNV